MIQPVGLIFSFASHYVSEPENILKIGLIRLKEINFFNRLDNYFKLSSRRSNGKVFRILDFSAHPLLAWPMPNLKNAKCRG